MKISTNKKIFFIFILSILSNKLITSKKYKENENDNYYQEYLERISNKEFSRQKQNNDYDYNYDFKEKPTSIFDFLFKSIRNRINSFFYSYNDYFDGLKYILSKYELLYRKYTGNIIINKTIQNPEKPKYEKYFKKEKKNYIRNLEEKNKSKRSYEYNNTDLYNQTICPTTPDLKIFNYLYFCSGKRVSKEEYQINKLFGEECEFYNNTEKLCLCPIHYSSCKLKAESRIRCMAKEVIVNNKINLTEYYDTFYEEFLKTPILENDKKIFDFSLKLKCGMPLSDDLTGGNKNFYLSNEEDSKADFDIYKTIYNNSQEGKQYTKEEINNRETNILKYYLKKKNLVLLEKPKLSLKFYLIDQQWVLPFRIKKIDIKDDLIIDLLSGEKSFKFTIDINDLLENEVGVGPFSQKNTSYPYFDKGDMHFFEFDLEEENKQIRFYPVRGEIKK